MVADFNVFCALCSCCLGNGVEYGSTSPRHLAIRRGRVARRTYSRHMGEIFYETDDESEGEKESRLDAMPWLREAAEGDDGLDSVSIADASCDYSYDPDVMIGWEFGWLDDLVALRAERRGMYEFIKCWYEDRNGSPTLPGDTMLIAKTDHEDPDEGSRHYAYGVSDLPDPPVFPMHKGCLEILSRAIFGVVDVDRINKTILYSVMHGLSSFCHLKLDYGSITGNDQDWLCIPGEEYTVISPTDPINLAEQIYTDYSTSVPEAETPLDLNAKVMRDPFKALPYEMTHLILEYLPGESLLALNKASWTIHTRTSNNPFWKQRLVRDMPWFWELQAYLAESGDGIRDYKALYMWLDKRTIPMYAMSGPFMGVANRRRIWGPCVELAEYYNQRLRAEGSGDAGISVFEE
ncbi:hypothetical protein BJY00DRAFT_301336 [Aspergillus carlsbadensis]|nr:hypothetical protein BJY00DRAFT_301336 [Aspergillus carlsbadensis]